MLILGQRWMQTRRGMSIQVCTVKHILLVQIVYWAITTDIQGRSQNLGHFYPGMGLKLGVFGFSHNQNSHGSFGAYVTCIYCGLSVKINLRKIPHGARRSWAYFFAFVFACVVGKNPKIPNLSPMADNATTQGSMQGLDLPCIYVTITWILTKSPLFAIFNFAALFHHSKVIWSRSIFMRYWLLKVPATELLFWGIL